MHMILLLVVGGGANGPNSFSLLTFYQGNTTGPFYPASRSTCRDIHRCCGTLSLSISPLCVIGISGGFHQFGGRTKNVLHPEFGKTSLRTYLVLSEQRSQQLLLQTRMMVSLSVCVVRVPFGASTIATGTDMF